MTNGFKIGQKSISDSGPTCFIADIAANHDGDLQRAIDLIYLAKESGADVAKFQHFEADTIVSDHGFKSLKKSSHQAQWSDSVYNVYKKASLPLNWTEKLAETCRKANILFMTSPYSSELVDAVDPYVPAYKIGSGDITWDEILVKIASKSKPVLLACGASTTDDVIHAMDILYRYTCDIVLMQCNTNYTASPENLKYINLNALKTMRSMFPEVVLGLSDHTAGHTTVLGAIALGARVIEKHFTDDNNRNGPDHKFAMNPTNWLEMVNRSRELEYALGSGIKRIEPNELDTVIIQRRSIRTSRCLPEGTLISREHIDILRPCPQDAIQPNSITAVIGKTLIRPLHKGETIKWTDLS